MANVSPPPKLCSCEARLLGEAFENLRDKLEGRQYVEGYVRTLTHEMKGPIAAIKGASELLQEEAMPQERGDRFLSNIHTETTRMQNVVDRLLSLSNVENRGTLDLVVLSKEVLAKHIPSLESQQFQWSLNAPPSAMAKGNALLLELALSNLLQNPADFSPKNGSLTLMHKPGETRLRVDDEGPGIPDYAVTRVFDHFYSLQRPESGKKSSGLGLCLVREIVDLHNGSASIGNHSNKGVCVELVLPSC